MSHPDEAVFSTLADFCGGICDIMCDAVPPHCSALDAPLGADAPASAGFPVSYGGGRPLTFQTMSAPGPSLLSASLAPLVPPPRSLSVPDFMLAGGATTAELPGGSAAAATMWDLGVGCDAAALDLELELEAGLLQSFI